MSAHLELRDPYTIDGDPADVRRAVLADLELLSDAVEHYTVRAAKQLRSAGVTTAMETVQGADALMTVDFAEAYRRDRPKEAALVEQLAARGEQFKRYCRVLTKAAGEYDRGVEE